MMRTADATAELMKLREAEAVGAIDDHRVGRRNVDARLDNGRADEQVDSLCVEIAHHVFQLALAHLSVRNRNARFRQQLPEAFGGGADRVDVVVKKINLPAALQLAECRFANDADGKRRDERLDGKALLRRRCDDRKIADSL